MYEKADQLLREKIQEGKFVRDPTPCFYLYELTMDGNSQTGVVACASIDDYRNNVIKKHENTRADKEEDRIRHVDTCSMQTGPIFLAYRVKEELQNKIGEIKTQAPVYDFVSEDGIEHRVWVISVAADVAMIEEAFAKIPVGTNLILHSDQGWQYQHKQYQRMLREKGIRQSMSRKGNGLDNAVIENFFGLLKSELLYQQEFQSMENFKQELIEYLDYYNNRRIKAKLKGLPPALHRQQALSAA